MANAIGPLSAAVQTVQAGYIDAKATVPLWALFLGGAGIVIGLATYGWRVMETVGKKITELTPSRGFCAMFGAATTVVIASHNMPLMEKFSQHKRLMLDHGRAELVEPKKTVKQRLQGMF